MSASYLIPYINTQGFFEIQSPFQTEERELYRCHAVRNLREFLAAGDDPYETIYAPLGVEESVYNDDLAVDMPIIVLQSETGHWHYVPARCMVKYPDTNGTPYRGMSVHVSLPAMPLVQDLGFLQTEITELVSNVLGVATEVQLVETSRTYLVPDATHLAEQTARNQQKAGRTTAYSRLRILETEKQSLLQKVAELEQYIQTHLAP